MLSQVDKRAGKFGVDSVMSTTDKRSKRQRSTGIVTEAAKVSNPAEPLNALRAATDALLLCPGCGKTDTEPKLKVAGFDPHHPKCYQKLVEEWRD